jgi:hypothetical protein
MFGLAAGSTHPTRLAARRSLRARRPRKRMNKERYLKYYLYVFGFLSIFVITTVPIVFGDVFLWTPRNLPTEVMLAAIYLSMGMVMIVVAKNPMGQKSFIDFLIVANLLHAFVMLVTVQHPLQIILDVVPIGAMGLLPFIFYPWGLRNFLLIP